MKANEIRAEMVRNNITVKSVAAGERVTGSMITQVIYGLRKTQRIRVAIAKAINKPVEEVFPETTEQA